MCFELDYLVTMGGGALSNETADSAGCGSHHLEAKTGHKQTLRFDLGRGVTNNQSEYQILIATLKDLGGRIQHSGKSLSGYSLPVHTVPGSWSARWRRVGRCRRLACALSWKRRLRSFRSCDAVVPQLRSGQAWSRSCVTRSCGRFAIRQSRLNASHIAPELTCTPIRGRLCIVSSTDNVIIGTVEGFLTSFGGHYLEAENHQPQSARMLLPQCSRKPRRAIRGAAGSGDKVARFGSVRSEVQILSPRPQATWGHTVRRKHGLCDLR